MNLFRSSLLLALAIAGSAAEGDGFVSIFNGKDLTGWDADPQFWSVTDGAITGTVTPEKQPKHNTFCIWRGGTVADFELTAKFSIDGGNSGIQFRSKEKPDWIISGYQADMSGDHAWTGANYEEKGRGLIAKCGEKVVIDANGKRQVVGQVGDAKAILAKVNKGWNDYRITATGNHVVQQINGVTTCEFTDEHAAKRAMEGLLAFQLHTGFKQYTVQFKDIALKASK